MRRIREIIEDISRFSEVAWPGYRLREYQARVAAEIVGSVTRGEGRQIALAFARQSGKDEMLAQLEAYLMCRYRLRGGAIVVVTPTYRPQGQIARQRLLQRLDNPLSRPFSTGGQEVRHGKASCAFLSASPQASARGETASLMLACNEAQDVLPDRWDAVFDPMGAASHATQVFSGTVWNSHTLLARQMRYLSEMEREDGLRRVFKVTWEEVAHYVPQYGEQVNARIAQLGRDHPFIRTEYFLEELDDEGKLLGPARRAQMRGDHPRQRAATPGHTYALLLDVAGAEHAEQGSSLRNRDATALTVVEVDLSGLDEPGLLRPRYRVVDRRLWVGTPHPQLYGAISDLACDVWKAKWLVVDTTGIGAGLAGFLQHALAGRVVPFVFTSQSKSQLGWDFLGLVESGRYKDYAEDGEQDTGLFWSQAEACTSQVADGPGRLLRWSVPDPSIHDDLLVSAALSAVLDRLDWRPRVARGR